MNDDPYFSKKFEDLRRQAEQLIDHQSGDAPDPSADPLELIQELKLYQAELEIQNEELKQAQQELSSLQKEYEDLYEFAPFGYLKLDAKGIIRLANLTAVTLLGEDRCFLPGTGFTRFIRKGYEPVYFSARNLSTETGEKQSAELRIGKSDASAVWVRADIEADLDETGSTVSWRMVLVDITELKRMKNHLEELVEERTAELEDTNTTLKVLLDKREKDQEEIEDKILANYQSLIEPLINRLKDSFARKNQHNLPNILESDIINILSPFSKKLTDPMNRLTPKELQIASLIQQDYSNKEMAAFFNQSIRTIDVHRDNIRKKLDIKNKKVNLKTYLMTLT